MINYLHLIILFFTELFFGDLSEEYFRTYKSFRKRNPAYPVALKECFRSEAMLRLDKLFIRSSKIPCFQTTEEIRFENMPFHLPYKRIRDEKGRNSCSLYERFGDDRLRVMGYRDRTLEMPIRSLFFLMNGIFFLGEYHIPEITAAKKEALTGALRSRYRFAEESAEDRFYITDRKGSTILFTEEGSAVYIRYFNSTNETINNILSRLIHTNLSARKETLPGNLDELHKRL